MNSEKVSENIVQPIEQSKSGWGSVANLSNKMGKIAIDTQRDKGKETKIDTDSRDYTDEHMHNMTVDEFSAEIGLSKASIYDRIRSLPGFRMEKEKREGSRVVLSVLSPEQQWQLQELVGMPPPPGFVSVKNFSDTLGITAQAIRGHIPNEDLMMFREKGEKKKKQYLSEEQQEYLLKLFQVAPENYMLIDDYAASIGVNEKFVRQRIPEDKLEMFKDPKSNQSRVYLSPELRNYFLSIVRPPDDYKRLTEFLKENGLKKSDESISSVISNLPIDKFMGENDSRPIDYVSPEQQNLILDSVRPPEGYMSYDDFSQQTGIEITRLSDYIEELGMRGEIEKYKSVDDSRKRYYLSPEQQKRIKEVRGERPPMDYKTPEEIATMMDVSVANVWRRIRELGYDQDSNSFIGRNNYRKFYLSPQQQSELLEIVGIKPPDGFIALDAFARQINYNETSIRSFIPKSERFRFKGDNDTMPKDYLSPGQQADIIERAEKTNSGTSIPESTIAFYLSQSGQNIVQGFKPDWLKNPDTGRNLEIDIFINPPGIGIEYDGCYYHQDANRDMKKDRLAMEHGCRIIHIREKGCPELLGNSICIERQKNNDTSDLAECIRQCTQLLNLPEPNIDIARDRKAILEYIDKRMSKRINTGEQLEDTSPAA